MKFLFLILICFALVSGVWPLIAEATKPAAALAADTNIAACTKYASVAAPKGDEATDPKKLDGCDPINAYYGVGEAQPNPVKARKCALLEQRHGWKGDKLDASVLVMIYANGEQVARNLDVAAHVICEMNLTANEKTKWLEYLEAQRKKPAPRENDKIEFCQRFFEESYRSACARMRKTHQSALRDQKFREMAKKFTPAQRAKFENLLKLAQDFFAADALWKNPNHVTGEARVELASAQEAYAWEQFEIWLDRLEDDKRLHAPTDTLADIDERLNRKYREYSKSLSPADKAPLTAAERLWIYYRDAFVDFAVLRYEPKDTNVWHAELSRQRIEQLTF